jgi:PAS domain S-box-containing protein
MVDNARILVVEDERIVALDIEDQLSGLGYSVPATVARGEEAIRQAAESSPDLVLMDIRLKGHMDGIEAAQHIRTHLDIPVVFLTAQADEATLQRAKVTDSYGYLLKPFEERELRSTIEMALYKHQMEQKLRQSQQWLAATLKSIGDAVIATDGRGYITFMNPVAQALTGWAESEALGLKLCQVLRVVRQETREPIADLVATVLSEGTVFQLPSDSLLIAKDDSEIPIDDSAAPIRDLGGQINGVVVVFRDISEQVRAREALAQYAAELEARNAELDAFAHTVAHDLKDPLSTVIGCAQMLEQYWPTMRDEQRKEFLQIVSRSGFQACNIVDELLLLAAVRSSEAATEPLHMASIVDGVERRLTYRIREAQAKVVLPENWPIALGYGPWVEEVWVNYFSNAIKYGGTPPYIELGATEQPDGMVRFWVRDNGQGISPEDQKRLFTPFTQLSHIRVRGHGLGLSIVQRIVKKLGGEVGVESTVGGGSTFFFTLPGVDPLLDSEGQAQFAQCEQGRDAIVGLGMYMQDRKDSVYVEEI